MSLEQRQQAQRKISEDARILVSTDAGGEGLNLQFAHIVVNYDLPWNPMKVEQRIGRVDRIGQTEPVKAYNMLFEDSVELRVHEVLQQKLQVILEEFGVDKTADVLDAEEGGSVFEQAIAAAILNPDDIEGTVDEAVERVRAAGEAERAGRSMYEEMSLDATEARRVQNHPIQHWIAQMVTSHVKANDGSVEPKLMGYDLTWPDGTTTRDVCFNGREAVERGLNHLSFRDERVRKLVEDVPVKSPSDDVPTVQIDGLPEGVAGYWGLYQVALRSGGREQVRAMPRVLRLQLAQPLDLRQLHPTEPLPPPVDGALRDAILPRRLRDRPSALHLAQDPHDLLLAVARAFHERTLLHGTILHDPLTPTGPTLRGKVRGMKMAKCPSYGARVDDTDDVCMDWGASLRGAQAAPPPVF